MSNTTNNSRSSSACAARRSRRLAAVLATTVAVVLAATPAGAQSGRGVSSDSGAHPLRVCATTPDLGALIEAVGGADVELTVFTKGTEDPHFTEPRPSFVKALSRADLYVENGLELELGWAPSLVRSARNAAILPGGRGHLDTSASVEPLEVPAAADRSMGDVHTLGNPHYLLDPVNGLRVARLIAARLSELRPEARERVERRLADFEARLGAAMVGPALASRYDVAKLAVLHAHGRLREFLMQQREETPLAGWFATLDGVQGTEVVADHNLWPYFAARFGLVIAAHLEPKPGISPTTSHLGKVVELMKRREIKTLLASVYYNPRYARFVAERTGARVVELANQVGARPGALDYVSMTDHNVRALAGALAR